MIIMFIFFYQSSLGAICFIHIQETALPSTIGNAQGSLFTFVIITSLLGPALVENFGATTMFIVFGILNALNTLYTVAFIKETLFKKVGGKKVLLTFKEK